MTGSDTESPSRRPASEPGMLDGPKLALIITCYNYESFVGHAIRSVLDQGRHDCEVVVVDGGSTDGSWDAISRTGVTAFKIYNSGLLASYLYGLDRTRAPFILLFDSDVDLKPVALATIIDHLDR